MEYRLVGVLLCLIEMDGAIVHLRMLCVEESDYLCSCPYSGAVGVGCHNMDGAVIIEGGVESHACADTSASDLPVRLNLGRVLLRSKLGESLRRMRLLLSILHLCRGQGNRRRLRCMSFRGRSLRG